MTESQLHGKTANLAAAIEALLFIYGEPMEIKRVAKAVGENEAKVKEALALLKNDCAGENRGLTLIINDNRAELATKPRHSGLFESMLKEELHENLTPAAIETLAVIAYAGPVPRSVIDYIRGVNSSFILRALLMRGLIERSQDPKHGSAYLYRSSFELLRHLGISNTEELPEHGKFKGLVEQFMKSYREPAPVGVADAMEIQPH